MFLNVEIAETPDELERGLMFRNHLADNAGMLFIFKEPRVLGFWGNNTFIPLDIAFIDKNDTIVKISHIETLSLKNISSDIKCIAAIEANYGYFAKNKIEPGFKVILDKDNIITFQKPFVEKKAQIDSPDFGKNTQIPADFPNQTNTLSGIPTLSRDELEKYLADNEDENNKLPLEKEKPKEEEVEEVVPVSEEKKIPKFGNIFEALNWAEENKKVVRIEYRTLSGRNIIRDVEPHGSFYASTTKRMILVTYDETVSDIRSFIIKQINRYEIEPVEFQVKFNFFG